MAASSLGTADLWPEGPPARRAPRAPEPTEPATTAWAAMEPLVRKQLREELTYDVWLGPTRPLAIANQTLYLEAPAMIVSWLASRFRDVLDRAAEQVLGEGAQVEVVAPGWAGPANVAALGPKRALTGTSGVAPTSDAPQPRRRRHSAQEDA